MTDAVETQAVSTVGSYSPPVQKAMSLGNKEYALKNYEKAVEHYGEASELQAQESGQDDPDILFLYGKALFQVAQKNSQVLGGAPASDPSFDPKEVLASAAGACSEESKSNAKISFSGDAEDGSDEDDEENTPEEDKEDDFQIAWEVLETAKMLYESKLDGKKGKAVTGKGPEEDTSIERKIADVCDLLGEVSIENESFDAAVQDLTRALELKVNLYEPSNPIVSEAHYKLSLALEFAQQPSPEQNKTLALEHLESAIESVRQRVNVLESQGKSAEAADAKEMIDELSIKVEEMKNPPKEELDVGSMFGSGGGFSEVLQAKLAETFKGGANDLTGLVRKKEKPQSTGETSGSTGEKRKIEGDTAVGSPGKKVRVEDVEE